MTLRFQLLGLAVLGHAAIIGKAFVPVHPSENRIECTKVFAAGKDDDSKGGFMQGVSNFFSELDAFVDDATSRRLGNGAAFYGKRKSNFYGSKDKMKKNQRDAPDPTEDYQGPTTAGYFKWMPTEDGTYDKVD